MIPYIFLALGTMMGVMAFTRPSIGIYLLALFALIIGGTIQYFVPPLVFIMWVAPIVSFFLIFAAFAGKRTGERAPRTFKWVLLFVLAGLLSFASNLGYLGEFIADAKNYYMFLSLPLLAVLTRIDERWIKLTGKVVLWAAFLQAPVSLFQHFFIVDYSSRLAGGDSIVGTFGGSATGGGSSGAQTAFLVIMIAWVMARYFAKEISLTKLMLYSGILLIPILLNETKIFFIYIPTAIGFLAYTHIRSNPRQVFIMLFVGGVLFVAVLTYYFVFLQHGEARYKVKSVSEYIERTIVGNAVRTDRAKDSGLGRIATYPFWWENNALHTAPVSMMFGHGMGATKSSGLMLGHLQTKPKYMAKGIATTGIAKLLWEVGIFGTIVYIGMFISAFLGAGRIRKYRNTGKSEKVVVVTIQISVIILLGGLFYDSYVFRTQALNFVAMATLAYYMYFEKQLRLKQ